MKNEIMRDVRPLKPYNLSKKLLCYHDACVHNKVFYMTIWSSWKKAIHRSSRSTPETSSSLEPSSYRSEKQLVGENMHGNVYTSHQI